MQKNKNVYSVKQVNSYVKRMFDEDFILRNIYVKGEISNCKYHSSGHIYFSLKDESGIISAVMFASNAYRLRERLTEGMQVITYGSVKVFERDGKYQLYVNEIERAGQGDLFRKFEMLKEELQESGMFDPMYKKRIPAFSKKIGVVTSETGAVIRDIYNVASRRNPYCQIILYPSKVQGDGAAETICRGIEYLDTLQLDTIIIGRGGGSIEDLWAFNEEIVAKAIFNANTPIISAVGHETDFTIADFVADLRAPTPSAAAELAVFDYKKFLADIENYKYYLDFHMLNKLNRTKQSINNYGLKLESLSPKNTILKKRKTLADLTNTLNSVFDGKLRRNKEILLTLTERLEGVSPLKRLSEGYSYVSDTQGKAIKSIRQVESGDTVIVNVADGYFEAEVTFTMNSGR